MEKTFAFLFLIIFSLGLIAPILALADIPQPMQSCILKHNLSTIDTTCTAGGNGVAPPNKNWALCCIVDVLNSVADIVFNILLALGILIIIAGAYYFLTAGGEPGKVQKGQNYILYGIIGLVIALLAKAIIALVNALF